MVAAVVHDVREHLRKRRRAGGAAEQLVFEDTRNPGLAHFVHEGADVRLEIRPRTANGFDVRIVVVRDQRGGRLAAPARVPDPVRGVDVRHRVADGLEAAVHLARELLRRQRGHRVEDHIAGPVVIVEKGSQIFEVHGGIISRHSAARGWLERRNDGSPRRHEGSC